MRLFVAIDLPETEKERLARICCGLINSRWVEPEQFHLNLRFIGEVDGAMFHDIREALAEINWRSFSLQLDGVGFFPPRGKPKVIWAGVRKSGELIKLRNRIESRLVEIGLQPEGRKFAPHITIARLKNTHPVKVARFLERYSMLTGNPFRVDEFHLFSSVLGRDGAVHYREESYIRRQSTEDRKQNQ